MGKDKKPYVNSEAGKPSPELSADYIALKDAVERLNGENIELSGKYSTAIHYIRQKIDQLLTVMGTLPLKPEELDDKTLIETDPIGIISNSFLQILKHLRKTNEKLRITNQEMNAIFDSAGAGILFIDKEMKILAFNTQLKEQFFKDSSDILGQPCHEVICNFQDPLSECPCRKVFQ